MIEPSKYYLRFAWLPTRMFSNRIIWLQKYYEVRLRLPLVEPVYTLKKVTAEEYVFYSLSGKILDGWPNPD